ncbi:hypothetical protein ACLB1N_32060 [Escherichia coli]
MTPVRKSPNKAMVYWRRCGKWASMHPCGAAADLVVTPWTLFKPYCRLWHSSRRSLASLCFWPWSARLPTVLLRWPAIAGSGHAGAHLLLPTASAFFLGPGAGARTGYRRIDWRAVGLGNIPPHLALPALFAVNWRAALHFMRLVCRWRKPVQDTGGGSLCTGQPLLTGAPTVWISWFVCVVSGSS